MPLLLLLCLWFGQGQQSPAKSESPANEQQQTAPSVSSPAPSENTGQTGDKGQQSQNKSAHWSDPIVLLQLFLFFAVAIQAGIYVWQAILMRRTLRVLGGQAKTFEDQKSAMQGQLEAMEKQAGIMASQEDYMKMQTETMIQQVNVMVKSVEDNRKLITQNERAVKAAEDNVETVEKTAIYANRAYVVAKIRDTGQHDDLIMFRLRIENTGNTPANNVLVLYASGLRDNPPHQDTGEGQIVYDMGFTQTERLGLVAPNGSYHVINTPTVPFPIPHVSPDEYKKWETGGLRFYCWGKIVYEDIFQEARHTEFCFVLSQEHPDGYPCIHGNQAI